MLILQRRIEWVGNRDKTGEKKREQDEGRKSVTAIAAGAV